MDLNQYLDIFLEESKEHLQELNDKLLILEKENNNLALVNDIFRSAHTLKGMAATMGFEKLATLTHEMESLLDLIRNNKKSINANLMDVLFYSVDLLEQMILSISNGGDDNLDISEAINQLRSLLESKDNSDKPVYKENSILEYDEYEKTILIQSIESGFQLYQITVEIDEETVLKSARAYMVFHELEKYGEIFKAIPSVDELENENFSNVFTVVLISQSESNEIKDSITKISEITDVRINNITDTSLFLNNKIEKAEKEKTNQNNAEHFEENTIKKVQPSTSITKSNYGKMIRVDIDRLDELMNLFSELVIDRGRLEQLANEIKNQELTDTVEHISRISSSLQNNILNLRMVSIEQVFNRFPRMIRDLAKELDKKINLNIIGADTELDRTVIDEIGDPLVHLLRNAVDHGLETTSERVKKNKPETGEITLKAFHSSNYVFIEVSDDGKGIDKDKILDKAISKGIITKEIGESLTEKQIFDLIFASGFSTAEIISDISGRGVGLDVVKSKIEALGGFVSIESTIGIGTKFIIQLPLTLSIISSMLIKIGQEKFAIPLSSIIETAVYDKKDIMLAHNQEVIDFRGKIVPLIYLSKIFDVPLNEENMDNNYDEISVVLVRKGDKMAGLVVNSFVGQQEIVLKSLGKYLQNVFAISGATILGDGQVALILDTNSLIK